MSDAAYAQKLLPLVSAEEKDVSNAGKSFLRDVINLWRNFPPYILTVSCTATVLRRLNVRKIPVAPNV